MTSFGKAASALALGALLWGCGGGSTGQPCTTDDDCDNGQTCYTAQPGGFCSRGCSQEGGTKECAQDTLCASHSGTLLCSPVCESQSDCREEYECNGVTGTSLKVCSPK